LGDQLLSQYVIFYRFPFAMNTSTHSRSTATSRCFAALGVAIVALTLLGTANSAPRKLSPPNTDSAFAMRVTTPANPANARVVYLARVGTSSAPYELWSTPIAGGTAVNLSGMLVSGGAVSSFRLSKDGTRVVFVANKEDVAKKELYSVPVDGSAAPVKRSGTLVTGGNVIDYAISDNSQRIVYRADKDVVARTELYSVPITTGSGMKIVDITTATRDVDSFLISPDSTRVVFLADLDTSNIQDLYSVGITSTAFTKISGDLFPGGVVRDDYAITPDSSRVVYRAEVAALNDEDLYSVPITGGGASQVHSSEVPAGEDVVEFKITPDGSRIIFRAAELSNGPRVLHSVAINSANSLVISRPASLYGEVQEFLISPDSARVIYKAAGTASAPQQLHSVPVNSNAGATVCPLLVPGDDIPFNDWFQISPDSSRVVFTANIAATSTDRLFSASISGGTCVDISGAMVNNGDVNGNDFAISPNSQRVAFIADKDTDGVSELYSVPITGGFATKISGAIVALGDVANVLISPDSNWAVFNGDTVINDAYDVFSAALNGGGALLDIDGDGKVLATTDMLLILRYQLGIRGGALITNALGFGATRDTSYPVEQYLRRVLESPSLE
jgi:Tol biopolymer transport system component